MGSYDTRSGHPITPPMEDNVSDLQVAVGQLLEDADIPQGTIDQIMKLIENAEYVARVGVER